MDEKTETNRKHEAKGEESETEEGQEREDDEKQNQEQDTMDQTFAGASDGHPNDLELTICPGTTQTHEVDEDIFLKSGVDLQESEDEGQPLHLRFVAFQEEHGRFFQEVKAIWDHLKEWGDDLRATKIQFHVNGNSLYEFLGPEFCEAGAECFRDSSSLWLANLPALPSLPSVRALRVRETINEQMDLWPAIVSSHIANTLPALELLDFDSFDWEQKWPLLRKYLRAALACQISTLPAPLKTMHLSLEYATIENHEVQPQNFLIRNTDTLSRSLHFLSTGLTTLTLRVSYITVSLFWDMNTPTNNTCISRWPNLKVFDITTGFEMATGEYWFRSDEDYPSLDGNFYGARGNWDPEEQTAEDLLYTRAGLMPMRCFRTRPKPKLFDELALSVSHAAAQMPKLEYFDLEFNAMHQKKSSRGTFNKEFEEYEGWGFYFRASDQAKFASTFVKPYWFKHKPGIDLTNIDRARTEWVFQCPYEQVQWEEPEEAKLLWQERSAHVDFDVVTFDYNNQRWERRRNGALILSSQKD
ncbi:hypothetical protein C7974DRAFT_415770 [Boeremia exigua]|uniref:uncharacterized protein n=1 Tax=Boeremia exigua TaxID=749465 RepID=UPI001E8E8952|nr:uncharacterized protein C7974DRAFT_415770 [Boeremia exigua]KAH6620569.1 hypothetical protein C7974DRAFT_415770 [Boeremia exigua]